MILPKTRGTRSVWRGQVTPGFSRWLLITAVSNFLWMKRHPDFLPQTVRWVWGCHIVLLEEILFLRQGKTSLGIWVCSGCGKSRWAHCNWLNSDVWMETLWLGELKIGTIRSVHHYQTTAWSVVRETIFDYIFFYRRLNIKFMLLIAYDVMMSLNCIFDTFQNRQNIKFKCIYLLRKTPIMTTLRMIARRWF